MPAQSPRQVCASQRCSLAISVYSYVVRSLKVFVNSINERNTFSSFLSQSATLHISGNRPFCDRWQASMLWQFHDRISNDSTVFWKHSGQNNIVNHWQSGAKSFKNNISQISSARLHNTKKASKTAKIWIVNFSPTLSAHMWYMPQKYDSMGVQRLQVWTV